jgi:alpha-mannosidase
MKYRELAVLLPCHSLEDFPLYHTGEDADSLLACWTALWHPALVATTGAGPKWHRVDLPPEDLDNSLILVPTVSVSHLGADGQCLTVASRFCSTC